MICDVGNFEFVFPLRLGSGLDKNYKKMEFLVLFCARRSKQTDYDAAKPSLPDDSRSMAVTAPAGMNLCMSSIEVFGFVFCYSQRN